MNITYSKEEIEAILGREEYDFHLFFEAMAKYYEGRRILITGANGSLGNAFSNFVKKYDVKCDLILTDIDGEGYNQVDVTSQYFLTTAVMKTKPNFIFHFAADKHAPKGEDSPERAIEINLRGTENIISAARNFNSKIILASTCKANNPETVYGATKLIADRLISNSGHIVARYYNVVETSGNVFEIWKNTDPKDHYTTPCQRYFITLNEALALTLFSGMQRIGRHTINPGEIQFMPDVYMRLYKAAPVIMEKRRGDREIELRKSTSEEIVSVVGTKFERIFSYHDK